MQLMFHYNISLQGKEASSSQSERADILSVAGLMCVKVSQACVPACLRMSVNGESDGNGMSVCVCV